MYMQKFTLIAILLSGFGLAQLHAQEAILTTGGNASGSSGTVSYSVGQVVYTTNTGANGSLAQGVQQPYEISVVTEIPERHNITLQCYAYPNLANDQVKLKVENYKANDLRYQLFDINGKLYDSKKIKSDETSIVMSEFAPATYFLKIIYINKEIKTFKIIKIKN